MTSAAQQMDFASFLFPKDRTVLYVAEVAKKLCVSEQHVSDLIEEGRLQALDISGGDDCTTLFIAEIASALKCSPDVVRDAIAAARAKQKTTRRYWRIPIEAYNDFLKKHHSFAI